MKQSAARKNILFVITDQQRADTIAYTGNRHILTPHLDRLCASGVVYENGYSELPECCPARAAIFSGQWGHRTGNMGNDLVKPLERTFVHHLTESGYHTEYIGKMHAYPKDNPWGFEHLQLAEEGGGFYANHIQQLGYDWVYEPSGIRHEYYYIPQVSQLPERHHLTTWTGDRAVEFLDRAPQEQPWMLTVSFLKPHPPFDPTTPYLTLYDPAELPLPVRSGRDREDMWPLQRAQNYSKWMESTDDNLARLIKSAYYACITQLDVQIGRLLDALEQKGLREDTLIVFTSDHGEMLGDHYQWGKRSFYNGSARVPFILSCPGFIPEGSFSRDLVGHRDIAPTLLRAADVEVNEADWSGMDLLDRLHGRRPDWREVTFGELATNVYKKMTREETERISSNYMAATERWKYIYAPNGGTEALFDLEQDPAELNNLAGSEQARAIQADMRQHLLSFLQEEQYAAALSEDGQELRRVPLTDVPFPRNRQYSGIDPYSKGLANSRT